YGTEKYKFVPTYDEESDLGVMKELKIYEFDPTHEEDDVEPVLSSIVPHIKSLSLLPHSPKGVYEQMPEEGITEEQYLELKSKLRPIDWSLLRFNLGTDEKYCSGP